MNHCTHTFTSCQRGPQKTCYSSSLLLDQSTIGHCKETWALGDLGPQIYLYLWAKHKPTMGDPWSGSWIDGLQAHSVTHHNAFKTACCEYSPFCWALILWSEHTTFCPHMVFSFFSRVSLPFFSFQPFYSYPSLPIYTLLWMGSWWGNLLRVNGYLHLRDASGSFSLGHYSPYQIACQRSDPPSAVEVTF